MFLLLYQLVETLKEEVEEVLNRSTTETQEMKHNRKGIEKAEIMVDNI